MNDIELIVLGLSYSQTQTGAYALVLAEKKGNRRIPIIIGAPEAQSIAIQLENINPLRPLTHDLFLDFASKYNVNVLKVEIEKLEEGIFYSSLVCEKDGKITRIDARTSDSVALALRFQCPIFTNEAILKTAGIILDESSITSDKYKKTSKERTGNELSRKSIPELEDLLQTAIEQEDYELASKIRDEINNKKK